VGELPLRGARGEAKSDLKSKSEIKSKVKGWLSCVVAWC
jgi:hypothetical protein